MYIWRKIVWPLNVASSQPDLEFGLFGGVKQFLSILFFFRSKGCLTFNFTTCLLFCYFFLFVYFGGWGGDPLNRGKFYVILVLST